MTRDWHISMAAAVAVHLAALFGFKASLSQTVLVRFENAVEVDLVAAPAAPPEAPAVTVPPMETPPEETPPPQEEKPPEPLPEQPIPEPVAVVPEPVPVPPVAPVAAPAPAPAPVVAAGAPSAMPSPDTTTTRPGEWAVAKYRRNPKPVYPAASRRNREEGVVLLTVSVTAQGKVARIEVKESSGHPLLDQSALNAVRRWEFEPARIAAIAVAAEIEVPVRFRLQD